MIFAQEIRINQRSWGFFLFRTTLRNNGNAKENQTPWKGGV